MNANSHLSLFIYENILFLSFTNVNKFIYIHMDVNIYILGVFTEKPNSKALDRNLQYDWTGLAKT